jgi:hypothetical protein
MRILAKGGLALMILGAACGGTATDQPRAEDTKEQESLVSVRLADYVVETEPTSVPSGSVTFDVENDGGNHDFVVVRTDLSAADLPETKQQLNTETEGVKVDLEASELRVLDSLDPMQPGEHETLTIDLEPGHYVLFCDLVDVDPGKKSDPRIVSHYSKGMYADFTVE